LEIEASTNLVAHSKNEEQERRARMKSTDQLFGSAVHCGKARLGAADGDDADE
jgi:hypothetical protein